MKTIQPINENVLIKLDNSQNETKTAGGLFIPDTAKEKPLQGEVAAISPDLESSLSVGDIVMYNKYVGTETSLNGEDFLIVQVSDILAKFVEVDAIPE